MLAEGVVATVRFLERRHCADAGNPDRLFCDPWRPECSISTISGSDIQERDGAGLQIEDLLNMVASG